MYGSPNFKSSLNNLMYACSPSFTTESYPSLPAALYAITYLVGAGGSSSSGFPVAGWAVSSVGSWVGSLVGALLVPGCSSVGLGQCVVWWAWDPVGFPQEEPLLLLWPAISFYSWTYLHLVYLPSAAAQHLPALMVGPLRSLPLGHL